MFPTGNLVDELEVPGVGTQQATMINARLMTPTTVLIHWVPMS